MQENLDPNAIDVLFVSTVSAFAVVAGSIGAVAAAGRKSVSHAMVGKRKHPFLTDRLSLTVVARGKIGGSLVLRFTLDDAAITLLRIELANQLDKTVGTAECVNVEPKVFIATVEPKVIQHWYNANRYWDGETKQLPIRVFVSSSGQATCRTIWVKMKPGMPPSTRPADVDDFDWLLDGQC